MSVINELEQKVEEVRRQLDSAASELRSFADLKSGLEETGNSLAETGEAVGSLASAVEACVAELNAAAAGLGDVVSAFKSSEIVGMSARLQGLEDLVGTSSAGLSATVVNGFAEQTSLISADLNDTRTQISKHLAEAADQSQKVAASNRTLQLAMLVLILINVAMTALMVLK